MGGCPCDRGPGRWQDDGVSVLDLLRLALPAVGVGLGLGLGQPRGAPWAVIAPASGALLGVLLWWLLAREVRRRALRALAPRTLEELEDALVEPHLALRPELVLIELAARGRDLEVYKPKVLAMLRAESVSARALGLAALRSSWPQTASRLRGYRPDATPAERLRALAELSRLR